MTDCETIERQLFELRDGTLDVAAVNAIEAHLAACSQCRELAHWDRRLGMLLQADDAPRPTMAARVHRRLQRLKLRTAVLAFSTAAAVLIAGALSIWRLAVDESRQTIVEGRGTSPAQTEDLAELSALFDPPPVDSLDVLNRQQNNYVAALQRMGEKH